ncbi:MAG: ABC transporter permease [Bacteroidaceae bacterium]
MSFFKDFQWPLADTFREVMHTIGMNGVRTAATGFAMASGIFLVIVLQGAGNGVIHTFERDSEEFAFDAVHVFGGRTTMPYNGMREGRPIQLEERDVEMVRQQFSDKVQSVVPVIERQGQSVSKGKCHISSVTVSGVYPQYTQMQRVDMCAGRFINDIDLAEKRKVLVLTSTQADILFPHEQAVGRSVEMDGMTWRVCGVYNANMHEWNTIFYAPYTTMNTLYVKGGKIDRLSMLMRQVSKDEEMKSFEKDYIRATSRIHEFSPEDVSALWIWNQAENSRTMSQAMNILDVAFWILGLLTMVSGVVGVSNIMLISVKERTREFGIRRAIGARPWNIVRMVMLESLVITLAFGYIGMVLGVGFCQYMDMAAGNQTVDMGMVKFQMFVDPTVDFSTCVTATLIMIVCGTLAGFFPARRAVKMKPVDALRA